MQPANESNGFRENEEEEKVPESKNAAQIDQVKINKVNEMDIKVSRFEKGQISSRIEEIIPNEEPLIQIRQFNGSGAASQLAHLPAPQKQSFLRQVQQIQKQLQLKGRDMARNQMSGDLGDNNSIYNSFSNLDERMNEHNGIHITNYPQVNLSRTSSTKQQAVPKSRQS